MKVIINEIVKKYDVVVNQTAKQVNVNISSHQEQISVMISPLGKRGFSGDNGGFIIKISGENITSHTPIVLVNNLAYKLNSSNPLHQFAFVGFSEASSLAGQNCQIKQIGEVVLMGWGLIPNQHYLAGVNGTLITNNLSSTNFTKVIGYAVDSNTLQIIKDSITINK